MFEFNILRKSKKSRARIGIIKTSYGEVETPTLVPVATQAVIKTLTSEEVKQTKSQILIANTFHLHLKPGEGVVKKSSGLHKFMNWDRPLMTDSGRFQVFSLGFGKDYGMGKMIKGRADNFSLPQTRPASGFAGAARSFSSLKARNHARSLAEPRYEIIRSADEGGVIKEGQQPKSIKITNDGVYFRSPVDGKEIFIGPVESIKIQEALGADIIFALDECTSPIADYEYTKKSLLKTHRWAKICLESQKSKQALFGIVQGGKFKDLRIESAKFIGKLPFEGLGIGGEFGDDKKIMKQMINWVIKELPDGKPRHLLGIGHIEDIPEIIKAGIDTFDCTLPTHYARHGVAFTSHGRLDMNKSQFLKDKNPLDKKCGCFVCQNYKRNYLTHLFRSKEITGMKLLTFHNLYFFHTLVEKIRADIKRGRFRY